MSSYRYLPAILGAASGGGTIAATQAPDVLAIGGLAGGGGAITWTQRADVAALAGSSPKNATISWTQAADALAIAGTGITSPGKIAKVAPFFPTDTVTAIGYQLYKYSGSTPTADGAHTTTGINAISGLTNGYTAFLPCTVDGDGGYRGFVLWDTGGGSPVYRADEIFIPPTKATLDLTQVVPTSNTAHTVGDALNAARTQGFGKWVKSGTTLTLYANDGTTVVRTFTLDDANAPNSRT